MGDFIASVQYGREGHEISENTASHRPFSSRSHHAVHGIHGAEEKSEYTHVLRQEMRSRLSNIELGFSSVWVHAQSLGRVHGDLRRVIMRRRRGES